MSVAWSGEAARLRRDLARDGYAVIRADGADLSPAEAARAPWVFAERLLGERPRMVERQPIKAVPGGRSFASGSGPAPLHTDSQLHDGSPPGVQVMVCVRPADRGGEHVLADGFALVDRVRRGDPDLFRALFEAPRRIPFVFGDVFGPTVALRGGALAFTHPPAIPRGDPIAQRLAPWVEAAPLIEFATREGEILIADNHRMLHGRRGFDGGAREFVRLLCWIEGSMGAPADLTAYADRVARAAEARLAGAPEAVRRRLGIAGPAASSPRLALVLDMLRGVPPGVIAARAGVAEPDLYRMRDAALAAAGAALAGALPASDEEMEAAIRAWGGAP